MEEGKEGKEGKDGNHTHLYQNVVDNYYINLIINYVRGGGTSGRIALADPFQKLIFFIESGLKMIQFKTKSEIFIQ